LEFPKTNPVTKNVTSALSLISCFYNQISVKIPHVEHRGTPIVPRFFLSGSRQKTFRTYALNLLAFNKRAWEI